MAYPPLSFGPALGNFKPQSSPAAKPQTVSTPNLAGAAADASTILGQHNVGMSDQMQLMPQFNSLNSNLNQGNHFGSYQDLMGLMGSLKKHNPALPGALSPVIQKHFGSAAGGYGPQLWQAANTWHGMVGDPARFTGLAAGVAPGVLQAAGGFGGLGGLAG